MEKTWLTSLQTSTPEEGFELAILLAQQGVKYTQPSKEIRNKLRPIYAKNAADLIHASEVIAIHFHTVAQANQFWIK